MRRSKPCCLPVDALGLPPRSLRLGSPRPLWPVGILGGCIDINTYWLLDGSQ